MTARGLCWDHLSVKKRTGAEAAAVQCRGTLRQNQYTGHLAEMGQACIKGPKSAGKQKPAASTSGHSLENTAAKQPEVPLPEGLDTTNLPEAKESYDAAEIQARSAQVRDPLEPISITATGNGHLPAAVLASTIPSSSTSASVEQSVRRVVSGGSSYSETDTEAGSATSDVELLRNYTQLAEMLTFSPYPLMLIDIELETQPIVFASQVRAV